MQDAGRQVVMQEYDVKVIMLKVIIKEYITITKQSTRNRISRYVDNLKMAASPVSECLVCDEFGRVGGNTTPYLDSS